MTRYGNRGKVKSRTFPRFPQRLGTRTRRGFPHSPATAAAGTMKVNTAEPLESRGCSDSCTEPVFYCFSERSQHSTYADPQSDLMSRDLMHAGKLRNRCVLVI